MDSAICSFERGIREQQPLSVFEKCGFASGDAACNMLFNPITMFLSFFYTDIFGLAPGAVAAIFLIVRIIDAIFDPLYGTYMDKKITRYGRFRPWIVGCAVPFALSCMLMFYTPNFHYTAKVIYAFLTYLLLSLLYSGVNMPYCSLGGVISTNSQERVSCQQFRFVGAGLASLFCTLTLLPLVAWFGKGNKQIGFFWVITIFAIMSVIMFFYCAFVTKERIVPQNHETAKISVMLKEAIKNDQWIVCMIAMFLDCIPSFVRGAALIYFGKYIMHMPDSQNTFLLALSVVSGMVGSWLTPYFTKHFDKVKVYKYTKAGAMALTLGLYFVPTGNITLFLIYFTILSVVHQIGCPVLWTWIGDVDDYGAFKYGKRYSGICASGNLFMLKVALGVGGAIVGGVLAMTHYQPEALQQPETAIQGIYALMVWIPAVAYLITVFVVHKYYKLDALSMERIEKALFHTSNYAEEK
ncbi:TPA: MFS transporter [Klebsiella aerogenes]|nr:MFS transporter [Klebsiella aerogenes]HDS6532722.1 MFS transporter [Klebsiella aerogenes]HDS7502311.1 MFS transporter [Klebsiella aerogenes]HDS9642402.1 MFS transporter [Klebsiella aerogenes]HDT2317327.1 MFS transporter [Klebsiella aerogenes]